MAGRGCTLAVCARPDGNHMLYIVWLSVAQLFTTAFFAALKNKKDTQPLYFAVVCPHFVIDRVSNICTTQSAYFPLGGLL